MGPVDSYLNIRYPGPALKVQVRLSQVGVSQVRVGSGRRGIRMPSVIGVFRSRIMVIFEYTVTLQNIRRCMV